jgi:hypothetical protein
VIARQPVLGSTARVYGNLRWPAGAAEDAARRLHHAQLCAACHAMHEFSGRSSALLTNHDQTLLVLVLAGLAPPQEPVPRACTALPFRTVAVQPLPAAVRAYVAAGNLVLADRKLQDDVDDGGGVLPRLGRWWLRRSVQRAEQRLRALGFPVAWTETLAARQRACEREARAAAAAGAVPQLEALAAPTADLLAQVFGHGAQLVARADAVAAAVAFGRAVGTAVYTADALFDHGVDARRGHFNAVAVLAQRVGLPAAVQQAADVVAAAVQQARVAFADRLPPANARIVDETLQALRARADVAATKLLPAAPPAAGLRAAEAGVCDLPFDACAAIELASFCGDPACFCCCDGSGKRRKGEVEPGPQQREADRGAARRALQDLQQFVGCAGVTVTPVGARGLVRIGKLDYEARTSGSQLPPDTPVRVVGVDLGVPGVLVVAAFSAPPAAPASDR